MPIMQVSVSQRLVQLLSVARTIKTLPLAAFDFIKFDLK